MSKFEERRKKDIERTRQKTENAKKVTKEFNYNTTAEDAKFTLQLRYNSINFNIFRKAYNQVRGKEVEFGLGKEEIKELRDYLNKMLDNWEELNKLDL